MSERIVRDGWVVSAGDGWVEVQVGRPDACGHCAASGACTAFSGSVRTHRARARNLCRASVGQRVRLEMEAGPLLAAAFVVYFLPSVAMLGAALAGYELAPRFSLPPDAGAAAGALLALALAALFLFLRGRRQREGEPALAAVEILDDAAPCPSSES